MNEPHIAKQIDYKGYTVQAVQATHFENPRTDWDSLSIMTCFHHKYNLGDYDTNPYTHSMFSGWDEVKQQIKRDGGICIMSLTLYDHGGLTIYLSEESKNVQYPQWDSVRVGFIYTTRERIKEWLGWARITKSRKEKLVKRLKSEVDVYDAYLMGTVYDTVINDADGEQVERLGSWYGYDFIDQCIEEGKDFVDGLTNLIDSYVEANYG